MNPVVDTIVVTLFILFIIFIFRGYHTQRLEKIDRETLDESGDKSAASRTDKESVSPDSK